MSWFPGVVDERTARTALAAASRDGHLALRRAERQQWLVERLHAARGEPVTLETLARELGVSARTVARDVERLRTSGVPLAVRRGRTGGVSLAPAPAVLRVELDVAEAGARMSALALVGTTASPSAGSAMRKLATALSRGIA